MNNNDFPINPKLGEIYSYQETVWYWDGYDWLLQSTNSPLVPETFKKFKRYKDKITEQKEFANTLSSCLKGTYGIQVSSLEILDSMAVSSLHLAKNKKENISSLTWYYESELERKISRGKVV